MKDNFEQIEKLLIFDSEDDFYHLQILKRKKENPDIGSNSYVVRTYCIRSKESLMEKRTEITEMCNTHNARAYINLSPRSFEKMAFHTLKKISDIIMQFPKGKQGFGVSYHHWFRLQFHWELLP